MAVIAATQPSAIPLIYSGHEIPNTKRLEFFEKDAMDWPAVPALQDFYSVLFSVRKRIGADAAVDFFAYGGVLGYTVRTDTGEFLALINAGKESIKGFITVTAIRGTYRELFQAFVAEINGHAEVALSPGEFLLFEKSR